jgi:hypothetical protein
MKVAEEVEKLTALNIQRLDITAKSLVVDYKKTANVL